MSKATPSLVALLGLAAVAGYQNRDKLSAMLSDAQSRSTERMPGADRLPGMSDAPSGGIMSEIGKIFSGGGSGGALAGGLSELVERFKSAGKATAAQSWVSTGPNEPVAPNELESVIGSDVVDELATKSGLSRFEVLHRLSTSLPEMVNRFTPEGRVPSQAEADSMV